MGWAIGAMTLLTAASIDQTIKAGKAQKKARSEAAAGQKAEQARERREQIREQRIRSAQLLQRSEASGTGESSGEMGALGSLSTNLSSNIAMNLGRAQTARNISMFEQDAASALNRANNYQALSSLVGTVASSSSASKNPAKNTTPSMG